MINKSKAEIVATIGPASSTQEVIVEMIKHQMDVARLNFSWGTLDEHRRYIKTIRESASIVNKNVPIIQDLSGPRVQVEDGHSFDDTATEALTKKDKEDLKFAKENNLEFVALSYVGTSADITKLKMVLKEIDYNPKIIAKIERKIAIENISEILEVSDAIMVARGDMGNEVPVEQIPFVQLSLITQAKKSNKPVITATEMLPSMIDSDTPTRSDVSDISNAILNGSDAVMLSDETASGKYPVEAVATMEKIVLEAEKHTADDFNPLSSIL